MGNSIAMEKVILVDDRDRQTGVMEKMAAHVQGKLHRAISVFIFNANNELLLQQRAGSKYHSPLLWTNTCCSHPRPGEDTHAAAVRRLQEEMGITTVIHPVFHFLYRANVGGGLTEYEYDHIYTGSSNQQPVPSADEVQDWKYISKDVLLQSINDQPGLYTEWFKIFVRECGDQLFNNNHPPSGTLPLYKSILH